jgi:serine O-acetyltransferase
LRRIDKRLAKVGKAAARSEAQEGFMFQYLRQDFRRCGETFRERFREVVLNPGMWVVMGYRYCRWVRTVGMPRWLRWPFSLAATLVQLWVEVTTAIQLSATAQIGPGLYIPHTGTSVVGSGSVLGSNCTLCHGVTIGHRGGGGQNQER